MTNEERSQAYWNEYFIEMAEFVSCKSKDPSTKVGAVIVRPDHTVAATGYNGFPRGMSDAKELYANREIKLQRSIHAEMNAIITAREPLMGYTLYVWPFHTCSMCSLNIIQTGIIRVVYPPLPDRLFDRWSEDFVLAAEFYDEANVETVRHN